MSPLLPPPFLVRLCFVAAFALAVGSLRGAPAAAPDILIVMPDQMRGDCLSAVGHPVVRTPHFDALAAEGALFRRGYSTVPSCIPARHALLTGQSPTKSGVVGYRMRPLTVRTLPECLAAAGYATVLVGRNMHQDPKSGLLGYQRQILASTYVPDDDYDRELKQAEPASGGIRGIVEQLRLDNNRWPAQPWNRPEEWHPTNWIVRRAREVVAATPSAQPLFLTASFYAPHPPLFPPQRLFDHYYHLKLPPAAMGDWVDRAQLRPEGDKAGHRVRLEGETLRRAQAGYFGLIEHLDEQVALLVADFKARSEKAGRAWIVVLTSDHGEMLGDHGFFRKCEPYEGAANIPFLFAAAPGLGLGRNLRPPQPVGLEDIMPTLLELARVPVPATADGRSLVAALKGSTAPIRPWLHFEHSPIYGDMQAFHALTDGHLKYIWHPKDGSDQLFDLVADPHEEHDLARQPAHRALLLQWRATLVQRLAGRPEGFSDGRTLIANRPYPPLQKTTVP